MNGDWAIRHHAHNLHEVSWEWSEARSGDTLGTFLCLSDLHVDSRGCDRDGIAKLMSRAKENNNPIMINGDTLDIMQSRNDPRRMSGSKMSKHEVPAYIDAVIEDAADFFEPYAENIVMFGVGNHESAQVKQLGTDCVDRLAHELRRRVDGCVAAKGGYSGWVKLSHKVHTSQYALMMHYYHGAGGSAPVTQGVINAQRNSQALPDADIVWTGHVHSEWTITWSRWRINRFMKLYKDNQLHFSTPGFVDSLGDGSAGWAVEKGNKPRPMGGAWVDMVYSYEPDPTGERLASGVPRYVKMLRPEYRRAY